MCRYVDSEKIAENLVQFGQLNVRQVAVKLDRYVIISIWVCLIYD